MSITEQVKSDVTAAMKAGEKDRVQALRLLLSELQKDAKEGKGDEIAVLRRERKRRIESADTYADADRPELEAAERREAELIAAYLPQELSDDALREQVAAAIAESGASSPKDMSAVMKLVMAAVGGQADGKRVSALVREALNG
ncbi:GatB/YqeY domain-containing protein [Patulibacter defluvii]|uniref:GatB/YqeY domain-containing protein n=1 Tax=Patulibacter defluvii TaxID=3095358 RepID=UPI002A74C090|nr:GatB/YqeY domain-containing protein [Patulibacter sp. DM4]